MIDDYQTEGAVAASLAQQAQRPTQLESGKRYAYRMADGSIRELDLTGDLPVRKAGTVTVRDVASFAEYFGRHADPDSELFADIDCGTVTAVLDAHLGLETAPEGTARWQQHRLILKLETTLPWKTWTAKDRQPMSQLDFAAFLEDNRRDLDPEGPIKPADFLEMAQSFQAETRVEFSSGQRLSSGETELVFKETTQAHSGREHKITIPTEFTLAIAPYDDCASALIGARFRYVAKGGQVTFCYVLDNPLRHAQDAVREITAKLASELDRPIMLGAPAS